jgi:acyl-CoA synthetase (AMP-forming)/AMP-acid ligase II
MGKGIGLLLELAAAMAGDRTAVGRGTEALTFDQLEERATAAAGIIAAADVRSVAYLGQSGPAFHVALFASALAGVPITPLNYRLADAQLAALIDQLDTPLLIADEAYVGTVADHGRVLASSVLLDPSLPAPADALPDVDDDSPAVVLFTSGTTSAPKGVVLRHAHLIAYVLQTVDPGSAEPDDAALVCVPPYHVAGVGTVLTNTVAGRRVVHLADFTPGDWLAAVAGEQVTSAMLVPTMLARIVDELDGATADAPALRSIAYGGSRISAPVLARALNAFPATGFVNAYGLTETSSTIALLDPDDHRDALASEDPHVRARLASAGRFVPGVEGQVRGEGGSVLEVGEVGELWVRGPQVSGEYLGSGSVVDRDGWFPTRDRAHVDAEGYLFIEGRSDDTIIRGGENIAPAEVEDVIAEHPAVREVAVIGLPDEEWGERLVAVVVARSPIDPDELRDFVRARIRGSRTPDEVFVRDHELPKTATGKLLRRELVEDLLAHR